MINGLLKSVPRLAKIAWQGTKSGVTGSAVEVGLSKGLERSISNAGHIAGRGYGAVESFAANPIGGQIVGTGMFMAPMMMMGSTPPPEQQAQTTSYTETLPQGIPPEMVQQMPSTLNDEQIARAKKRAEEQAALNQFYAQSLQQYGGQ